MAVASSDGGERVVHPHRAMPREPRGCRMVERMPDRRLLHRARSARAAVVASAGLGTLTALLLVAQAWLLAEVLARGFDGDGLAAVRGALIALLAVVIARAATAWLSEAVAALCSARVKSELRGELVARAAATGEGGSGPVATLATRGIDALDGYFSLYLPQLLLAVIVPVDRPRRADRARLGLGGDRRRDPAADPDLHGAGRGHDARAHGSPGPQPAAAERPLPRRRRRPADAEGLRPREGPGGGDRDRHVALPRERDGHAADLVPVRAGARAAGDDLDGAGRGRDRAAAARRAASTSRPRCSCWCSPPRPTCRCAASVRATTPAPRAPRPAAQILDVLEAPLPQRGTRTDVPDLAVAPDRGRAGAGDLSGARAGRARRRSR